MAVTTVPRAELIAVSRAVTADAIHAMSTVIFVLLDMTLDVPADKLTVSVINKYLELKGRGAI